MDKKKIVSMLEENELSDIEEIKYKEDIFVLRFYYDFDDDEIKAAKAFADDESKQNEENQIWTEEFYLPYLSEVAIDNVGEYIEEVMENISINAQFMSYDLDGEEPDYCEFIAVFYNDDKEIDIESVLDELMI